MKEIRNFSYTRHRTVFESEAYTEDGGKTWRWVSNDRPCPVDACKEYGIPCDPVAQAAAVSKAAQESIAAYRKAMEGYVPGPEEMYEMRAAFGPGVKVVNVLTGQTTQL